MSVNYTRVTEVQIFFQCAFKQRSLSMEGERGEAKARGFSPRRPRDA